MIEESEDLVAYCGLYCGDCHGYTGRIADLARDLRKEIRQTRYDLFAKEMASSPYGKIYKHYDECYDKKMCSEKRTGRLLGMFGI